ncbi:MAG: OmpA family protein, partial [Pseudomonadota bacterium]
GHTDKRPITTALFPSNWELSTARSLAIVKYLTELGISPMRLAATGFGQHHPLDDRENELAYARNRRIELKLTSR